MKKHCFLLLLLCMISWNVQGQTYALSSPDGEITVDIKLADKIYYDISLRGEPVLTDNAMTLTLTEQTLGKWPKVSKKRFDSEREIIRPTAPLKYAEVVSEYNRLKLDFKGGYSVEFRAFNDGVAYRFITRGKGTTEVLDEEFSLEFPSEYQLILQQPNGFKTSCEEPYSFVESNSWKPEDKMAFLPALIDTRKNCKILISEADLTDYPGMFLKGTGKNGMTSVFPKIPLEFGDDGDRSVKITREANYIARTSAGRAFPWRYFVIAKEDKQLIENTMTCRLSTPNVLEDVSWIKPGQVSWEWWNGATPYGQDVNFKAGCNLETYKYFIDFASKNGIPYILMDEGWAKSTRDPFTPNPDVDLHELIRYGKEKNVGIILWLTWLTVENHFDLFKTFHDWGVAGVKIDFMDRSDQWMVDFYERVAREAAANKLFVDFHGSFKPAGLECKYPNVLSYEGVRGMENMGWCQPDNTIYLPFIRNAVGAMDYTPGAMISMQPEIYYSNRPNSASIGTRAYQMALYTVFESGLQMLADNPTMYYREQECTDFITKVPVTWDETRVLAAELGQYVVVAKRKGEKWFIGAITNGKQPERSLDVKLDFLTAGKSYRMTAFCDGINADRQAMDYRKETSEVKNGQSLTIHMVRNGGFTAVIE